MQIKINLKIFFFIAIFCITKQIHIYGLLMFFALLHELGHLIAGMILGFKTKSLSINPMGLCINFKINTKDYNEKVLRGNVLCLKRIIIAISGPAVNFFIIIITATLNEYIFNVIGITENFIIYSNLLIGIFNLIPIYPLDGGQILKNFLHITKGLENSYIYINYISNMCMLFLTISASISILILKNIAIVFIIIYLWHLTINENKLYGQRLKIYEKWDI